jgi:hypothetical protein
VAERIQVQAIPQPKAPSVRRQLARLCYFYPQYTLKQAERMSYRDVVLLLNEAARIEAAKNHALLEIVAAPHSEKGKAVQELSKHYQSIMNGTN